MTTFKLNASNVTELTPGQVERANRATLVDLENCAVLKSVPVFLRATEIVLPNHFK